MHRIEYENRPNQDGLLKTTTWGTLIALSLLAATLGFKGSFSSSPDNSATLQAEAHLESVPSAQNAAPLSTQGGSSAKQSGLNSTPFNQYRRNDSYSARPQTLAASPALPNLAAKQSAQPQISTSGASNDNQDPQSLIAAKIAPDLKGIDPQKPVSVIVQYRQVPSSELAAEGLTANAELPLIRAQLVTARSEE